MALKRLCRPHVGKIRASYGYLLSGELQACLDDGFDLLSASPARWQLLVTLLLFPPAVQTHSRRFCAPI